LGALTGRSFQSEGIEERVMGALVDDSSSQPVQSYFNIPLVIREQVVGVLTVAHTQDGLYQEDEMTLLYRIVQQATGAVERLEHVVATERSKLASMVESLGDGTIMTDTHYRLTVINPRARYYLGLPRDKEISELELADALDGAFDLRAVLEESILHDKDIVMDAVPIGARSFQVHVRSVRGSREGSNNKLLGSVVTLHDVSHEKALERMRQDFTSMIVHELRSPLDSIKKIGEMMRGGGIREDKETYDEYVSMIHASSAHMLELVNDLLDVSKIESGKFELAKRPTNIKQIVRERVRFFEAVASDSQVTLKGFYGSNIPDMVMCDPMRLTQVLNNLVSNGLKHTRAGGHVTVQLLAHTFGKQIGEESESEHMQWFIRDEEPILKGLPNSLICAVTDSGEGITQKDISQLFKKFGQLHSVQKRGLPSTGLGLVVVKGIVEAHGGRVGVSSIEGKGSTFFITLPIAPSDV
jgi:signal transduction histidine kinase